MFLLLVSCLLLDVVEIKVTENQKVLIYEDSQLHRLGIALDFDKVKWSGKFKNGLAEGKGTLKCYRKKSVVLTYKGIMVNGKFHDTKGILNATGAKTKLKYAGNWVDGMREGEGRMMWAFKRANFTDKRAPYYDGGWSKNVFSGSGILYQVMEKYEGEFKNGLPHGEGILYIRVNKPKKLVDGDPNMRGSYNLTEDDNAFIMDKKGQWAHGEFVGE